MAEKPNILLITGDYIRWDTIAGRSVCRTPSLNRVADEGVVFDRSYTPISLCCPARAALLTGSFPWHNGVYHQVHVPMSLNPDLAPDVRSYAQHLHGAGYRTGYVGKWHASRERCALDLGYEFWRAPVQACLTAEAKKRHRLEGVPPTLRNKELPYEVAERTEVTWPGGDRFPMWMSMRGSLEATQEYYIAKPGEESIRELASQKDPWLLEIHFPEPHDPYKPLLQYLESYPAEEIELPDNYTSETFSSKPAFLAREASLWEELSDEEVRQGLRHYYAYCEQLDSAIGVVLDALEKSGRAPSTLVVCTADHGDSVGSHRVGSSCTSTTTRIRRCATEPPGISVHRARVFPRGNGSTSISGIRTIPGSPRRHVREAGAPGVVDRAEAALPGSGAAEHSRAEP